MRVVYEGIAKTVTQTAFIEKKDSTTSVSTSLSLLLPSAVADTVRCTASVSGCLLGNLVNRVSALLRMPTGCGEQTMIALFPNIVALRYLEATKQDTKELRLKALEVIQGGYQQMLKFVRKDGGFSVWGEKNKFPSTWLTAYVVHGFSLAKDYITIDRKVTMRAIELLSSKQNNDGSFREDGGVAHKEMLSGTGSGLGLTCFVVLSIAESFLNATNFDTAIEKAMIYIESKLEDLEDPYFLALCTKALEVGKSPNYASYYEKLMLMSNETTDSIKWNRDSSNPNEVSAVNIEIGAYAILAAEKMESNTWKIVRYLMSLRNSNGGFFSTQDTVRAIMALARYAEEARIVGNMTVELKPNAGKSFNALISTANALGVQMFDLNNTARQFNISIGSGSRGTAIISLSCNYYENQVDLTPRFVISHKFIEARKCFLKSSICFSYIPKKQDVESNMALVTVSLPSGFIYDSENQIESHVKVSLSFNIKSNLNCFIFSET
jgi:uncharacterized protein YfaS (alpha-2-macroglobulin family)